MNLTFLQNHERHCTVDISAGKEFAKREIARFVSQFDQSQSTQGFLYVQCNVREPYQLAEFYPEEDGTMRCVRRLLNDACQERSWEFKGFTEATDQTGTIDCVYSR